MVRTFCSGIYLQLMIVMCFKKHLIFSEYFPDDKDCADVYRENVIMIVYLSKSHVLVKCGEIDAPAR